MDYKARITALMTERNNILAQISEPLSRINMIDGQMMVLLDLKNEDEAAQKAAREKAAQPGANGRVEPLPSTDGITTTA